MFTAREGALQEGHGGSLQETERGARDTAATAFPGIGL